MKYISILLVTLCATLAWSADSARSCKAVGELSNQLKCTSDSPQSGCKQVDSLDHDLKCDAAKNDKDDDDGEDSPSDKNGSDFLMKKHFGPTSCLASNLIDSKKDELVEKCQSWTDSKKAELKKRYRTSTCEDSCNDCSTGLKRCEVNGVVHYKSK
jgi:hypothetical protein